MCHSVERVAMAKSDFQHVMAVFKAENFKHAIILPPCFDRHDASNDMAKQSARAAPLAGDEFRLPHATHSGRARL
jgi:hypothetical protein